MNWSRAIVVGMFGAILMLGFVDAFHMLGITEFSYEWYIGYLFYQGPGDHAWTIGFLANIFLGGLFGMVYAVIFEYFLYRATPRTGVIVGFFHAAAAGAALFPFFQMAHGFFSESLAPDYRHPYPELGLLGIGMGFPTLGILLLGHLLFGLTMGTLYGPVRVDRAMTRNFEPGETGFPGEPDVVSAEEDPEDRMAV